MGQANELLPPARRAPVPPPKHSVAGGERTRMMPSSSQWAMGLRHESDKGGKKLVHNTQTLVADAEKERARRLAADRQMARVMDEYAEIVNDPKVAATLRAFTQHVPIPGGGDIKQLKEVLERHRQRTRPRRAAMTAHSQGGRAAQQQRIERMMGALRPTTTALARSVHLPTAPSEGGGDVRKDEWYSLSMLKDLKAQERDAHERAAFLRDAKKLRSTLTVQEEQLRDLWDKDLLREKNEAAIGDRNFKQWTAKEKKRKADLLALHLEQKALADVALKEQHQRMLIEANRALAEEVGEVRRVQQLMRDEAAKEQQKQAELRRHVEELKAFNTKELERKRAEIKLQAQTDAQAMKDYDLVLLRREQEREHAVSLLKQKQDLQALSAQGLHAAQEELAKEDEERALRVQKERRRQEDLKWDAMEKKKADGIAEQLRGLGEQGKQEKERARLELQEQLAEARRGRQRQAQQDRDEEMKQARKAAEREEHAAVLRRQIHDFDGVLRAGCGLRGITLFEMKYNSKELQEARRLGL